MRRSVGHLVGVLLAWMAMALAASGQTAVQGASTGGPYTIHVDAREVVLELVAIGSHGRPVTDLKASDLQVFEVGGNKRQEKISSVRLIDPAHAEGSEAADAAAVAPGKTCATRSAPYYMLAYHVGEEGWTSGYHEIQVTTSREHVKLSFRHRYYVGTTVAPSKPQLKTASQVTAALQQAACYHPQRPVSLNLRGEAITAGDGVQLAVVLAPGSVAFTSLEGGRAQFDYGICAFSADGTPRGFLHATDDALLSPTDYARTMQLGYQKLLAVHRADDAVFVRLAVLDRQLGNFGLVGIALPPRADQHGQTKKKVPTGFGREVQSSRRGPRTATS